MSEERQMILKMLKEGKITVEEAEALIDALSEEAGEVAAPAPQPPSASPPPGAPPDAGGAQARSLGEEIREVVQRALEGVRAAEVNFSLHDVVHDLFGLASASEEVEVMQSVAPGGRLVLRNPRGDVRLVRGGSDLRVRAHKQVWGRGAEEARALLAVLEVRVLPAGKDVHVEPVADGSGRRFRYRVDMTVEVPEGIAAEVDVRSGDVSVEGLTADLEARIASGDLQVAEHRGAVHASVKSGDVSVREAESLEVQVARGDVEVDSVRGAAQVRVASGDVSLGEVHGAIEVAVQSGDVTFVAAGSDRVNGRVLSGDLEAELRALGPAAQVRLEVLAGDLDVEVAPTIQAAVRAEATAGDIDVALPLQNRQHSRRRVEGILGAGGDASIDLRVTSGGLSVSST